MGDEAAKRFFGQDYPDAIERSRLLSFDLAYFSAVKDYLCEDSLIDIARRMHDAYFDETSYSQKNYSNFYGGDNADRMKDIFFFCQSNRIIGQNPFAMNDVWAIDILKRMRNAFTSYASQASDKEFPIFMYDNSRYKPKDEQLLVTTEAFYSTEYIIPVMLVKSILPSEQFFSKNMDFSVFLYEKGSKKIMTMSASNELHQKQIYELADLLSFFCLIRSYMPEERMKQLQGITAGNIRGLNF